MSRAAYLPTCEPRKRGETERQYLVRLHAGIRIQSRRRNTPEARDWLVEENDRVMARVRQIDREQGRNQSGGERGV